MTGRAESIYRCLDDLPELCEMADLEGLLPVSRATMYRKAERGEIPCMRLGVRYIFSREHLKRWLERSMRREAG